MIEISAKSVCGGIAIGRIKYYSKKENDISPKKITDIEGEIRRYREAKAKAIRQLGDLYETAVKENGKDSAEIFNVHAMLLEDVKYNDTIVNLIRDREVCAEYAVAATGDSLATAFGNMSDPYLRARNTDIKDITDRVIRILKGIADSDCITDEPVIILAEELFPSEMIRLAKHKLISFVTRSGGSDSHTAILARTMGLPALVGADIKEEYDGLMGIVDGDEGRFIVDPGTTVLEDYFNKKKTDDEKKALLMALKGKDNVTKSGKRINLYANICSPDDLPEVMANDAGGIGLFRSEFLYLDRDDYPTEDEQFMAYKKVLEAMAGKKVIIRTLDIGADKQADYFELDKEDNPALGFRAIRICFTRPEVFRTQLRALYRASAFGNLAIMYPMIISVDEVLKIKAITKSVREELNAEGIKTGNVEEGIMIETPAAALVSDELAKYVDFFSIGTNDLTQYTLAADRRNSKLGAVYDQHHPAVLKLIRMVADNGHREGIWTGICGELAADTAFTETLIEMGVDELSVPPNKILQLRCVIRNSGFE